MTDNQRRNVQVAPYPDELNDLVEALDYKRGWEFSLASVDRGQGSEGLTLNILITTPDTYHPDQLRRVMHYMPVPPAAFDQRAWRRWLFEQILQVERHEAMEFFQIGGRRPYAPSHGPGNDPYMVREVSTVADAETSFRGERDEGSQGGH